MLQNTERCISCDQPEFEGGWKVMDVLSHSILFPFLGGFLSSSNFHLYLPKCILTVSLCTVFCVLNFTLSADLTFYGTVLGSDPQFTKLWFNKTLHTLQDQPELKHCKDFRYYNCDWPQNHRSRASCHTSLGHNNNKEKWHFELVIHL